MKLFRFIPVLLMVFCPGLPVRAELADGILAIVNNSVITREQVVEYVAPAIDALRQEYAGQMDGASLFEQKVSDVFNDGLEQLIERQLILHEYDTSGYVPLPDSFVDELVQDRIRERYGNRITFMKTLQAQGVTYEQFRKDVRDQYIISAMRSKNVSQEIVISPYKIENYYLAHQDAFKVGDEIKLRMIVLNKSANDDQEPHRMAAEILTQIKQGAAFAQMASVYSQGSQREQGGDWGWVERSVLRKELADVAFSLKPGQMSDIIETPQACYLMLVEQRRPAHVRPLSEVRDDIEATLRTQEQSRLEKQWIAELKKKSFIRQFP
ncbi:MAG TPA: peptidylprolyl isomerase [Candidatus Acidoferrales bacterium]|nr:peptidylprolyl isomerase [Candidatus Acidoferrales bacterium]